MNRKTSIEALNTVLSHKENCEIIENRIYEKTKNDPVTYFWCIYQCIGLLLQDKKRLKELAKQVKAGKIGWKSPSYDEIAEKIEEFDSYLDKPFEVVEGVAECGKCGSKKTWSVQKQTRSSDEPMTTFSRCVMCGNEWSYSG